MTEHADEDDDFATEVERLTQNIALLVIGRDARVSCAALVSVLDKIIRDHTDRRNVTKM